MLISLQGAIMGFSIAAPVGPIGLLCIRRSMRDGRLAGFISGLGAATADTIFGIVAALGLTAITDFLVAHRTSIQLIGGVFLLAIGIRLVRSRPIDVTAETAHATNLFKAYASTLLLTLANPITVFTFLGIFANLGIQASLVIPTNAAWLVAGVFVGSAAWWLILSGSSSWLSRRLDVGGLRWINIGAGSLVLAFGLWQFVQVAFKI